MRLIEQTGVPEAALPVAVLRDHLRLGNGFGDDAVQDVLLAGYLRAAMAAVEGRIGKALMTRRFVWRVERWRDDGGQALPLAPVVSVVAVVLGDAGGGEVTVDPARYRLMPDTHRPRLMPVGAVLPQVPVGGFAEVVFDAGFGAVWADVPADLRQAVLMLAAQYHELRHDAGLREAGMPFGVLALIERWRTVRVLGGGGR